MTMAHCGDMDSDSGSSGEYSLMLALFEVIIFSPKTVPN